MKSIGERLDTLVMRAMQEETEQKRCKEEAVQAVIEMCLESLEKAENVSSSEVAVRIPTELIQQVPEWSDSDQMAFSLQKLMQDKILIISSADNPRCLEPGDDGSGVWIFRLIVK